VAKIGKFLQMGFQSDISAVSFHPDALDPFDQGTRPGSKDLLFGKMNTIKTATSL